MSEAGHYESLSDLQAVGTGFAALWVRGSGTSPITSSKGLYVQLYDPTGAPQWNGGSPVVIFAGTSSASIQNGYFPTFIPDGAGGAVFGWYETSGARNAYIQHVLANGTLKFGAVIPSTGPTAPAGRIRVGAGPAYHTATGEYYLAWPETDGTTQTQNSTMVQKFDSSGNRLWGDSGVTIVPVPVPPVSFPPQQSFVQCQAFADGCMVFLMDSRNPPSNTQRVIDAARVSGAGEVLWHNLINSDSGSDKSRLASMVNAKGFPFLAYGWGDSGSTDIGVSDVNGDGTIGPICYANCDFSTNSPALNVADFTCFLQKYVSNDPYANCDNSTQPPLLNVADFTCFLRKYVTGCP